MSEYEEKPGGIACGYYECPICYRKVPPKRKKAVKQVSFADLMGRPVNAPFVQEDTTYAPDEQFVEKEYEILHEEVIRLHRIK